MEESGSGKTLSLPELVLRARGLERRQRQTEQGMLIHVLWGKYRGEVGAEHEGFGLQLEDDGGVVCRIPDLSTDGRRICQLAERLNRYQVSRYHIDDIVADFLAAV